MEDYEEKKFIAKAENTILGDLLDVWAEEDLKTGSLRKLSPDYPEDQKASDQQAET